MNDREQGPRNEKVCSIVAHACSWFRQPMPWSRHQAVARNLSISVRRHAQQVDLAASERADILPLRYSVEEFAASIDSYAICLNSALAALRSERLHAGGSVHPLVPVIVANLLQAAASEKRTNILVGAAALLSGISSG